MKTIKFASLLLIGFAGLAYGQTTLTSTTTTAAMTATQTILPVTSATGITVSPRVFLYIIDKGQARGELVSVSAVNGLNITVKRNGQFKSPHVSGAYVVISAPDPAAGPSFQAYNPLGSCVAANTLITPWINQATGEQWLCSTLTLTWVPGWNNGSMPAVTAAVASAAGPVLPSGPIFHITGTAAITGFTLPVGFAGGEFRVIPDAIFTWTAAGNIGVAGTAVVNRTITFIWDANVGKWFPSYV